MKQIKRTINYEAIVTWVIIFAIIGFAAKEIANHFLYPKSNWIYYQDVEIGKYDSIRDKKNITKIGDTLIIREHSQGKGRAYIWGKYQGYVPEGGPVQIGDTTYYVYHNVVVRKK